ncbi:hypothetical protein ABR737_43630 [Streptomyces sp. Edi2]|uniref:hypothetical protein n=1 Tax=Streptomyces sp. Edi2 TaxID=3162528 RepID=UPI003305722B
MLPLAALDLTDELTVVTDGDPGLPDEEKESGPAGTPVAAAADAEGGEEDEPDDEEESAVDNRKDRLLAHAVSIGAQGRLIVVEAQHALEADLLAPEVNEPVLRAAFLKQRPRSQKKWREILSEERGRAWGLYLKLRKHKKFISKGEFAHDVALAIENGDASQAPPTWMRPSAGCCRTAAVKGERSGPERGPAGAGRCRGEPVRCCLPGRRQDPGHGGPVGQCAVPPAGDGTGTGPGRGVVRFRAGRAGPPDPRTGASGLR